MTEELNHQQITFCDFPQIPLDDIDERCGEVYITLNGTLIFHCSLCASNYGSVDNFLDHLSTQHYKDVQEIINDVKTCRSDSETILEDYSNDKICQEQNSDADIDHDGDVKEDDIDDDGDVDLEDDDVNDDDIDEYEEMLQSKEAASLNRTSSENIFDESNESDAESIADDVEIKKQSSATLDIREKKPRTKPKRQYIKSGKPPFICKICGKEFGKNVLLKSHSLIHCDERNYKCQICSFAFKNRPNLDSHMRRHLGINKIECGYCPKTFFTQTEVKSHRRIHTGERPYACSLCDKAYTTPNRLRIHNKCHNSEPTFKCNYCEKAFYERSMYNNHMIVHTREKQFVCEICGASYPRARSWRRHSLKCTKSRQSNESPLLFDKL